jgi:demethoxyubiquinone hydroxylase (CLK1/Coq7/Cat5 family)
MTRAAITRAAITRAAMTQAAWTRTAWTCLALLALCTLGAPADASPRDTKVGDVRAVYSKTGVSLRETPSAMGKAIATLPFGARVRVVETKLPWMRVETLAPGPSGPQTGWMKAFETVELSALATSAAPAHTTYTGSSQVNARDVSAAGRQLDAGTEKRFRTSRKDLDRAYRLVDAMEKATIDMDAAAEIEFIVEGDLGRKGRDYARPGRVAPRPVSTGSNKKMGGLFGKAVGLGLRELGAGKDAAKVGEVLAEGMSNYVADIKKSFSPQQEYFLGRAVAAEAIAKYGVDKDDARRAYVRQVGDTLVRLSSRLGPNFGGYHFEVLDSDEVNGVSGPGGFVLVTRGAVQAAESEAELAGILAHELAHVRLQHGEKLLRQSKKFPSMIGNLAGAAGKAAGAGQFSDGLVQFFTTAVQEMSGNAINHGYGRAMEFQADTEGTHMLFDVFYDQAAIKSFLLHMRDEDHQHSHSATHASPAARAAALDPTINAYPPFTPSAETVAARKARFDARTGKPVFGVGMK